MLILDPAKSVIERCGGDAAVARLTGRHLISVRRWTWPKKKRGLGGFIPADAADTLARLMADDTIMDAVNPEPLRTPSDDRLILDPARTVIRRLGGVQAVAKLSQRHFSRVRRWTWPREKGGTDGIIPQTEALKLLRDAADLGIDMTMDDFVAGAGTLSRVELSILASLTDADNHQKIAEAHKLTVEAVREIESQLRACPIIAPETWARVQRRRAAEAGAQP